MKSNNRNILYKILICVLLLLCLELILSTFDQENESIDYRFPADTIKCAIVSESRLAPKRSSNIAFNYELLSAFGNSNSTHMRIKSPQKSPLCWEELATGDLDLVVFNATDSIPEEFIDTILFSMPIKSDDIWIVRKDNFKLLNAINFWLNKFQNEDFFSEMTHRYFRSYKMDYLLERAGKVSGLSPYDELVKKYADKIGMDWRLLSAIIFQESQYNMAAVSNMTAKGLMQVLDMTAIQYGVSPSNIFDPESNVKVGTALYRDLISDFLNEGLDSANAIKFALASYNSGGGALAKRRAEAAASGLNPKEWEDVAAVYRAHGGSTPAYIEAILQTYEAYQLIVPRNFATDSSKTGNYLHQISVIQHASSDQDSLSTQIDSTATQSPLSEQQQ